ncbi:MAG: glycoside hydrolase family 99-like domain-containing protein [Candidatus Bathyarchaeia archaeon]
MLNYAKNFYPTWRELANTNGFKFILNAYPGFNNTNCTGVTNPVALPTNETAFREMLTTAKNYVDNDLKIIMITSWNEWLEGTAIEPSMELGELFLHAIYDVIPEFSTLLILPMFIIVTLIAIEVKKKTSYSEEGIL